MASPFSTTYKETSEISNPALNNLIQSGLVNKEGKAWGMDTFDAYNPYMGGKTGRDQKYFGNPLNQQQVEDYTTQLNDYYSKRNAWETKSQELANQYGNPQTQEFMDFLKSQPEYKSAVEAGASFDNWNSILKNAMTGGKQGTGVESSNVQAVIDALQGSGIAEPEMGRQGFSLGRTLANTISSNPWIMALPMLTAAIPAIAGAAGFGSGAGAAAGGAGAMSDVLAFTPAGFGSAGAYLPAAGAGVAGAGASILANATPAVLSELGMTTADLAALQSAAGLETTATFTPASSSFTTSVPTGTSGASGASTTPLTSADKAFTSAFQSTGGAPVSASSAGAAASGGLLDNTLIGKLLSGTASASDYLKLGGTAISTGAQIFGGGKDAASKYGDYLQGQASDLQARGQMMQDFLTTGKLPPGAQASINQATAAAKARIKSQYASHGMSGSSAEMQDITNVDMEASARTWDIAQSLFNTGLGMTGTAQQLYQQLAALNMSKDDELIKAIGGFVSMLGVTG